MADTPDYPPLPPALRLLRGLVIVLMITMICGVIAVVWLLVTRMPDANALPVPPKGLALTAGTSVQAVTMGAGWTAVVTGDQRILIFNADGSLRQEVAVKPAP